MASTDDIFFADFPNELAGQEGLCKYTVRKWLIGHAVMHGWSWEPLDMSDVSGILRNGNLYVRLDLEPNGLRLKSGNRIEFVETAC